jgi:hypothetical protein
VVYGEAEAESEAEGVRQAEGVRHAEGLIHVFIGHSPYNCARTRL